tara:strand:- start:1277 stop:1948 length:672 start_codon:yes stop_codon:yes gene_type:complete
MLTNAALYKLQTWLSPSYPVGAYAFSHGIENAVETSLVNNASDVTDWVATIIGSGNGYADLVFLAAAWDATTDNTELADVIELAHAFQTTAELRTESVAQGTAFLSATRHAWPCTELDLLTGDVPIIYPVAVGVAAAGHDIDRKLALQAYGHAFVANLVSAAIRLIPLGQSDGQQTLATLEPAVNAAVARAAEMPLARVATSTLMVDITSMNHETQYTRLFRS